MNLRQHGLSDDSSFPLSSVVVVVVLVVVIVVVAAAAASVSITNQTDAYSNILDVLALPARK